MHVWPAIDLRDGRCVRLEQGDYGRETVFGDDPAEMAEHWVKLGARRLHLVDLDGARDGGEDPRRSNLPAVQAILKKVGVPCELGGGIRDDAKIERLLAAGLSRLVVGTRAVQDPAWFAAACQRWPGALVAGIDARQGKVATHGWLETSEVSAVELAMRLAALPLAGIVYTDIATDGMLQGPNFDAMAEMKRAIPQTPVIASGGVTTADDVRRLAELGLDGCIVGRSLYEGRLKLPEALEAAGDH